MLDNMVVPLPNEDVDVSMLIEGLELINGIFETEIGKKRCMKHTTYNLGTGCGTSAAFEKASGKKIPIKLCPRRPGDATAVYAFTEKAEKELRWKAKYGVEEICRDQWTWGKVWCGGDMQGPVDLADGLRTDKFYEPDSEGNYRTPFLRREI